MKMKNIFRFVVTAVVIVSVILSSLIFVHAADTINASTPEELKAAFKNVTDGGTINITGDITMNEKIYRQYGNFKITGNGKVTWTSAQGLNLDACTVTIEGENLTLEQADSVAGSDDNYLIMLEKTNATAAKITINSGTYKGFFKYRNSDNASAINTLTINGGTFYQTNHLMFGLFAQRASLTVNDGEFIGNGTNQPLIWGNDVNNSVIIKGGTFKRNTTANGDKAFFMLIGNMKEVTIGNTDGTGPVIIQDGSADMFAYDRDSKSGFEFAINGGTFEHKGTGNIIGYNADCKFESKTTINGGKFKHSGTGSVIKTPARASKGAIAVNGATFEHNSSSPIFALSDKCNYTFNDLNITSDSAKELFNLNGEMEITVSNSNIKNKGPVIKIEKGPATIYKPNTTLTSTSGQAIIGDYVSYDTYPPRMLEMTYSKIGVYGAQTFISLTPGETYQLDVDCKPQNIFITPQVHIYYKQKGKTNYAKKLYVSTTDDNPTGTHISFKFTLPDDTVIAATDNIHIILSAELKEVGKIWYASASVKKVENNEAVGENLIPDPDFKNCPATLTTSKTATWSKTNSQIDIVATHITSEFKEPLPVANTPKMWEIGNRNQDYWGAISQEITIEGRKWYKFEMDYKAVNGANALIRIGVKAKNASSYTETDIASICYQYKLINVGTKYIMIFRPKDLYNGKNFRIYLGRNDSNHASNATAYFANVSLREDISSTDGAGEEYGENLLFNGNFEYGELGAINSDNVDVQLYGWKQLTNGEMFSTYNTVKLSDIPEDFFAVKNALTVQNAEGNVTLLETVEAGKQYIFSFNNKYDSKEEATPYIYAITKDGNKKITPIKVTKDIGGKYNTSILFEMPKNLVAEKNLRIGLEFSDTNIIGYFSDFALHVADKYLMASGDNIIEKADLKNVKSIPDYDYNKDESVWMKEGTFGTVAEKDNPGVEMVANEHFDIIAPKVLTVSGRNKDTYETTEGQNANIYQEVSVTAGKKYQLSFNAKWITKGRATDKACVEITYNKGGTWTVITPQVTESATEYKETYTFTAPADISSGDNLRVTIHISSAYVQGHFANFSLVEIDDAGNAISEEIIQNGDFTAETAKWNFSSGFSDKVFTDIPENYFSKVNSYKTGAVQFSNSDDYAMYRQHMMLEANTQYEMVYEHNFTDYVGEKVPYGIVYLFYYGDPDGDGELNSLNGSIGEKSTVPELNKCKQEKIDDYTTRTVFTTPENIRTHGEGNMYLYCYMRQGSAGYWGGCQLYKLDAEGNRISGNIMLNGDFGLGNVVWDTQKEMRALVVEKPTEDFLKKITDPAEMVTSKGTDTNSTYSADATVDAYKAYRFVGKKLDMNGEGVNPQVLYRSRKQNGKYVPMDVEVFYDSDRFVFEIDFTIPDDAIVVDGKADIRVQMTNGIKGKGYFTDLKLVERGKLINLAGKFKASSNNYQKSKYDEGVFIFYYDDKKFEDGDWSGELSQALNQLGAEKPGEIRGKVVNKNGEPLKNIKLLLTPGNRTAKTNANGEYRFTNVKPGTYQLFIVTESGTRLPVQVDLQIASSVISNIPVITVLTASEIETDLNSGGIEPYGALRGYLYDAKGKPMANVKVYIRDIGYVVTNKDGMFQFDKLPVGEFEIYSIMANGEEYIFRTVEIKEFTGTSVKLSLEGEGFNWWWLLLIIPAGLIGIAAIAGGTILVIVLVKKKKAKQLNN